MSGWIRLWRDMPTDPKFRVVSKRSGRPLAEVIAVFTLMLTSADESGCMSDWCHEDAAAAIDTETEHVASVYDAMQGKVLDGDQLTGWNKRQPKREDDSRERVRDHRERKKANGNASVEACNADVTQRNAPESESESESDTETESEVTVRSECDAAPAKLDGRTPAYAGLKMQFNGTTEIMLEFIERSMGPGSRTNAETWLASTVSAHGAPAVSQAFAMIAEKSAAGEISTRPLPHWSSLAAGLKAKARPKHEPPAGKRTLADVLRERREAEGARV